jgi:hypothetical protein
MPLRAAQLIGIPGETVMGDDIAAAYVAGYADGATLLHWDGHDRAPAQLLARSYARYVGLESATLKGSEYRRM